MEAKTKFYVCYQNNSGGYTYQHNNVDKFVCVEAKNVQEAQEKFNKIFENYRDFCPCCGERWYEDTLDERDGHEAPLIYGVHYKTFKDKYWCNNNAIIIYYANGEKEIYDLTQNLIEGGYNDNK